MTLARSERGKAVAMVPTRRYRRSRPRWVDNPGKVVEPLDQARKQLVRERDGDVCAYCGIKCDPDDFDRRPEIDHIVARKSKRERGSNRLENLTVACHACNVSKGNRPVAEWVARQPFVWVY